MPHQNSVFHEVLQQVPWDAFDRLVDAHGADAAQRGFSTRSQLVAMLYAQLAGAVSLREIEAGLLSHQARLYHLHATPAARSTLADANRQRPSALFAELFTTMVQRLPGRRLRREMGEAATYLIDATSLALNAHSAHWARYSAGVCGAKAHVIYDAAAERPIYATISAANVNDITAAQDMPIEPGATYVFDLGYYDYAWWAKLDDAGCRIVTRFKTNTPLIQPEPRPLAKDGNDDILSDRVGYLPARQAMSRKNPFQKPVREVCVRLQTGKVLRILSNDLDATARQIADLYKRRWEIELFFRWIKQTLKITRFLGTSENAVRIQIAVALIAFLLLRLAQETQNAIASPLTFARLIRLNIMHRRTIRDLLTMPNPPNLNPNQGCLALCKT